MNASCAFAGDSYDVRADAEDYKINIDNRNKEIEMDSMESENRKINIAVDKPIINGNAYAMNGNGNSEYFAIKGNNVTKVNLYITNAETRYYDCSRSNGGHYGNDHAGVESPSEWHKDDGVIQNKFEDNTKRDGGAIRRFGNMEITISYFNYDAALHGGLMLTSGYDNTFNKGIVEDSFSGVYNEIFFQNFENGKAIVFNSTKNIRADKVVIDFEIVDGEALAGGVLRGIA